MADITTDRKNIKVALEAAHAEIGKAITRVDTANGPELENLKTGAKNLAAFVDFNSGCGKALHNTPDLLANLRG
jgi:hypothetical protein